VTFLFTDIEGSTQLLHHLGDRYGGILQVCRSLMRTAFQEWHGYEVDTQGDAFFVAFARATDALSAAVAAQRALFAQDWPDGVTLRVRIGLHTGEPERSAEGYVGLDVHRAARIMSAGHGGQVLLSQTTRDLVEHVLPEDVHIQDLGEHRLKDLGPPTRLFQVRIVGLPTDFPPLKTLDRSPNNLPIQPTPFIGREKDVAAVGDLLQRESVRLLTLTGPGGVGKTRLALQVAADVSEHFKDGTWFVSLAPLQDPNLVLPTISQTLGLRETAGQRAQVDQVDQLTVFLREKRPLLLLDNFEHVQPAAVPVADLLAACPLLKILVTSREPLHLRAEQEFAVPVLAVPDPQHLPDLVTLSQYEAVALFIERAQAVQPEFQVTNANAPAVAEICARLDGLPLAIELAAARIKLFPPQALLARLGQRLQFLTQSARDTPARQQTLRQTLRWSYDLLSAPEQQVFWRLAVFVGGCTLPAVEAAAATSGDDASTVLERVASLLDKNLLQQTEQEGREPRLQMLETIREYGWDCLTSSGELEAVREAHALYFLALAEEGAPQLTGSEQAVWRDRLTRDEDNLRAACAWILEHAHETGGLERAVRLGDALTEFWQLQGRVREGGAYLTAVVAASDGAEAALRARVLCAGAAGALMQDDPNRAGALLQESLTLFRALGDTHNIAYCLCGLAGLANMGGTNYQSVAAQYEEGLALYRALGDRLMIARVLVEMAWIVSQSGAYRQGLACYEEALVLHRSLGNTRGVAWCLMTSAGCLVFALEDQSTVHARLEESLALFRSLGSEYGLTNHAFFSAWIAFYQGDLAAAQPLAEQSLAFFREAGMSFLVSGSLALVGRIAVKQGDLAVARAVLEESLREARKLPLNFNTALCLEGLAQAVAAQGKPAWAAQLWGGAEVCRERCGVPMWPVDRRNYEDEIAAVRLQLGEQAFAQAWAEGRAMTLEQLLAGRGEGGR
jgi:predicted ATPase/class 3 adenylate cyclase